MDQSHVEELKNLVKTAIRRTREISQGLSPVSLNENGFHETVKHLLETYQNYGIETRYNYDDTLKIEEDSMMIHCFRIIQESLTNAIRHGKATRCEVFLKRSGNLNILKIKDNGSGYHPGENPSGLGIKSMQFRAHQLGGEFLVETDGSGTEVSCIWRIRGQE
jgi:signal transduction histidine kinase